MVARRVHSILRPVQASSLAVVAALAAAAIALGVLRTSAGPTLLDYVEGLVFVSVERLAESGLPALYPPIPEARPFVLSPYTPGFYLEWAAVRALLGLEDSILPGRVVALFALLGCVVLLGLGLRRTVASRATVLLFASAWLTTRFVIAHIGLATSDTAAILWSVAGVYLVGARWHAGRPTWPALFLFAAALLTKQSIGAGLAAATAFLLLSRRPRQAGLLFGGTLALVVAIGALVDATTAGGFAPAVLGSQRQPIVASLFRHFLIHDVRSSPLTWILVPLAVLALRPALRAAGWERLAVLYVAFTLAVALATSGKIGAANYYYLEAMLALCWAAGAGFAQLGRRWSAVWQPAGSATIALAALTSVPGLVRGIEHVERFTARGRAAERELAGEDLRGPILGEYYYFPIVERAGGDVYVNDVYVYAIFWESGRWPVTELAADLACGRVAAVLTSLPLGKIDPPLLDGGSVRWQRWDPWRSPVLATLILRSYELVPGPDPRAVYLYRPRAPGSC